MWRLHFPVVSDRLIGINVRRSRRSGALRSFADFSKTMNTPSCAFRGKGIASIGTRDLNLGQSRSFGSKRSHKKRVQTKPYAKPKPPSLNARIKARPEGEKEYESKYPMPDPEMEKELGGIQNEVIRFHKAGNYTKALEAAKAHLKATQKHFGKEHPATAAAYNNTGLMYKLLGSFDESRAEYVAAQKIYKTTVGRDHSSYASTLHNLGNLNRSQIHVDTTLRATDRISLVESALQFLEEAYDIRSNELGAEHPHTVSSRSSWGATLATRILHHHKLTQKASDDSNTNLHQKRFYVSILPSDVTETAWEAAEEHLRQALDTAIRNPRGASIAAAANAKPAPRRGGNKKKSAAKVEQQQHTTIQTLSAANAAQNLAVFLKTRATTVLQKQKEEKVSNEREQWLDESRSLYGKVLAVQAELLESEQHPDVYATKHSLAELLEVMGDLEAANAIRQQIIDTYSPETVVEDGKSSPGSEEDVPEATFTERTAQADGTDETSDASTSKGTGG